MSEVYSGPVGVWTYCRRCQRDNWCVKDWDGELDDISGDATEFRCWNDCDWDEWDE